MTPPLRSSLLVALFDSFLELLVEAVLILLLGAADPLVVDIVSLVLRCAIGRDAPLRFSVAESAPGDDTGTSSP